MSAFDEMHRMAEERHARLRQRLESACELHDIPVAALDDPTTLRDVMDLADALEANARAIQALSRLRQRYPSGTVKRKSHLRSIE